MTAAEVFDRCDDLEEEERDRVDTSNGTEVAQLLLLLLAVEVIPFIDGGCNGRLDSTGGE
jgi:hypothetical protein